MTNTTNTGKGLQGKSSFWLILITLYQLQNMLMHWSFSQSATNMREVSFH